MSELAKIEVRGRGIVKPPPKTNVIEPEEPVSEDEESKEQE